MILEVSIGAVIGAAAVAIGMRYRLTASIESIIEAAPDAILAVRSNGTIRAANRRVTAIFGYEPAELIGQPIELLVPERHRSGHPAQRRKFAAEGVSRRMGERMTNLRGLRKDGSEVPVDISLSVVRFASRSMVFAAVRDLTPTLKAQADEQARLRQILDTSPVGVAITVEGEVRFANPSFTALLGVRPGDAMVRIYKNPEDRKAVLDRLERDGIVRDYELTMLDAAGKARAILLTLIQTQYDGRNAKFGWAVDVTRLKEAEAAMQRVNFLSDSALDLTKAGYWYIDLKNDPGYYEASDRVREIFGEAPKPDRRYHLMDEWHSRISAVDPEAGRRVTELFQGAVEGKYDQYDAEYPYRRPSDGRIIWTRARAFMERDASGMASRMFGVQQDLTDQRAAEELRDSLTHMVVHDLRSPLSGILMSLELLGMSIGDQDPKSQDIIRRSLSATQQLTQMISTLLDVNKMEAGEMTLSRADGDLRDPVRTALATLSGLLHTRDVVIEADAPVTASFDSEIIMRVVSNLVGNAVKFTSKGGRILVRVSQRRGGACVEVIDSGRGIPAEYHTKIFEKFGQVEARQKKQHLGTGLGLAFCKLALEAHGGSIGVESEVGKGSTFWFVLH